MRTLHPALRSAIENGTSLEDAVPYGTLDREKVLAEARANFAELALSILSEKTDEQRLQAIQESFESLPEEARRFNGKALSWDEALAAIPNREEFLEGIKSLSKPTAYWINEQGELVVGDGHSGIRSENKGADYSVAEARAKSVPNRGLITAEEYKRVTSMPRGARFEKVLIPDREGIWLQSKTSKIASWSFGNLIIVGNGHKKEHSQVSSRYVVRTQLAVSGKNITVEREGEASSGEGTQELVAEDHRLSALRTQYEALSNYDRTYNGKLMTWEQVVSAIPDISEFLAGVDSLATPELYGIDNQGQLVVGDGCTEPAEETLDLDYYQSRTAATAVKNRGLITFDEYNKKNKGQFEAAKWIWVESGESNSVALCACSRRGDVYSGNRHSLGHGIDLGSRRVLRVKLNLAS